MAPPRMCSVFRLLVAWANEIYDRTDDKTSLAGEMFGGIDSKSAEVEKNIRRLRKTTQIKRIEN
jgi:hypothetical protein